MTVLHPNNQLAADNKPSGYPSVTTEATATTASKPLEIPPNHGLLIYFETSHDGSSSLLFRPEPDHNWSNLHPNIYAPASLTDVRVLHGGGSGATVFHGIHPTLQSLVMKHGSHKDAGEILALADIAGELRERSGETSTGISAAAAARREAARDMQARIPEFKMVYVSPKHLRDRWEESWNQWRKSVRRLHRSDSLGSRTIVLSVQPEEPAQIISDGAILEIQMDAGEIIMPSREGELGYVRIDQTKGMETIATLKSYLFEMQKENHWKFTLGQKTIGGKDAINGADVHLRSQLQGAQLETLMTEFLTVIRNLQLLTYDDERDVVDTIRAQTDALDPDQPALVTPEMDAFVGSAILKNFDPEQGRFAKMYGYGLEFSCDNDKLNLDPDEVVPVKFLGRLLRKDAALSSVFLKTSLWKCDKTALDTMHNSWHRLLRDATSSRCPRAVERIWTCGLTDAGLHNTFLSRESLWLFDLGEPQLMPTPAFLTKFLMSFFHTLGMEPDPESGSSWVCRFEVVDGDKLRLSGATVQILPGVHAAFRTVLERFSQELFNNDPLVKKLLLQYVVLQLLSDASFCLGRWHQKGGGTPNYRDRKLGKWLWRCLWDNYIAAEVLETYREDLEVTE